MTTLSELRTKTDDELVEWLSGWKEGTKYYIAGMIELKRRQERPNEIRGWIAVAVSAVSLVISLIAVTAA
jgi:hypothetical protein